MFEQSRNRFVLPKTAEQVAMETAQGISAVNSEL